ncbi:MAG TPA: 2-amino-4-hydroxy-6-hydroxymethyldihydropteridine diphosphokinase [Actinomycetales bacterium]|nr:2-amino-4-hydroxy-6-hydroxymethyldihydropteridine diphosphokinase [Actinomycetales bacterium]
MAVVTERGGVTDHEPVPVVLALGANLGDAEATIAAAVQALDALDGVAVNAVSPLATTAPVGGPEQPDYRNAVALATTTLAPGELLDACHAVEQEHGRARLVRWGARTLDIDVVAYGRPGSPSEVVLPPELPVTDAAFERLVLPHARAHRRAFVLAPWLRVDPDAQLRLPDGEVRPVAQLLAEAPDAAGLRW